MAGEVDVWQNLVDYLSTGIFGGTAGSIIMIVFILGLSAYGLYKARKIFKDI